MVKKLKKNIILILRRTPAPPLYVYRWFGSFDVWQFEYFMDSFFTRSTKKNTNPHLRLVGYKVKKVYETWLEFSTSRKENIGLTVLATVRRRRRRPLTVIWWYLFAVSNERELKASRKVFLCSRFTSRGYEYFIIEMYGPVDFGPILHYR